jgi:HEPN domain-containing protein
MAGENEKRQQELARLLLEKAKQDVEATRELADSRRVADEIVGFHAQQAIEKALKAVLTRQGLEFRFTHDLITLLEQVKAAGLAPPTDVEEVEDLTAFAVQFRYSLYDDEPLDRSAALDVAQQYIDWADEIIESPLKADGLEKTDGE